MRVRIDDYPTGVKPIIADRFKTFDKVLSLFENARIDYHLGVVPTLITDEDIMYLKSLKHCHICLHGYDHNFIRWNSGYPEDREEFRGCFRYKIKDRLQWGLDRLSSLNMSDIYIPTFNRINQNLIDMVRSVGFKGITTGVQVEPGLDFTGLNVYTPKDTLYGRAGTINMSEYREGDHIALHLTWEAEDMIKYGQLWNLPNVVKQL